MSVALYYLLVLPEYINSLTSASHEALNVAGRRVLLARVPSFAY